MFRLNSRLWRTNWTKSEIDYKTNVEKKHKTTSKKKQVLSWIFSGDYDELWTYIQEDSKQGRDPREVIGKYLRNEIMRADETIEKACGYDSQTIAKLKTVFKQWNPLTREALLIYGLGKLDLKEIFREVQPDCITVLVPRSNAKRIVPADQPLLALN